jgi:hypothetical protein
MADDSPAVTDASAFKQSSLVKEIVLSIVTLGIYTIYWWYKTNKQLANGTDADISAAWRTVGLFIPLYGFVVVWRTCHDAEAVVDQDGVILFLLFMVFAPAGWFLVQSGINDVAGGA